jgi:hypothetical protein
MVPSPTALEEVSEQLAAPGTGTNGGILETFNHLVPSEARYRRRLAGSGPPWVDSEGGSDPCDVDRGSIGIDRQICAILTAAAMEPPDVQAWAYADATGRGGERHTED